MNENQQSIDNLEAIIASSKSSLILLPQNPSFDEVAAGLSLYLSLRNKSQISINSPTPMTVEFNRLVGVNKITTNAGDKNLTIRFRDYNPSSVDKVNYDIKNGEFYLTIIPKGGTKSPLEENVVISYSGVLSELIILVGGKDSAQFSSAFSEEAKDSKIVHVGNEDLVVSEGSRPLKFARPGSSVCEAVAELIKESGYTIDADIATNLLAGILSKGQSLSSSELSADTFALIADLIRAGGRRTPPVARPDYPVGSIPGEAPDTPKDWYQAPKVYKGTSIN